MQVPDPLVGVGWVAVVLGAAGLVGYWVTLRANHREHYGLGSYGETDPASKTNCPSCGARVDAGTDECDHCSDPLPDERGSVLDEEAN